MSKCGETSQAWFATTRWSVVLAAQNKQSTHSREALEKLCHTYWYPLYAFARRQGYSVDEAGDFTQGFFARCLEKDWLAGVSQNKGRFRHFLLASMKHFLSNERAKQQAKKRGGDRRVFSLDVQTAETRYTLEPQDNTTPEQLFERRWALALLEEVLRDLEQQYIKEGKAKQFNVLKPCLLGQSDRQPYHELSARLDCTEGATRVMVHRLKNRYRDLLREHIAHTIDAPEDLDAELQHLKNVLSRR